MYMPFSFFGISRMLIPCSFFHLMTSHIFEKCFQMLMLNEVILIL
ncbi:hypothetical protein BAME_26730 [Bacillus sp. M 2-6]|nr:hypothetical protein BAME_26730 [Bacillus sp. M 2-6]